MTTIMTRTVTFLSVLVAGCNTTDSKREAQPVAKPTASSSEAVAQPVAKLKCSTTVEALGRLQAPTMIDDEGSSWPPEPDGHPCGFSNIQDLDGDGRPEIQVSCQIGSREFGFNLYQKLADGCLKEIGDFAGFDWEVSKGKKASGFPSLVLRSGRSHDDVGTEDLETNYTFDSASGRYIAAKTAVAKTPENRESKGSPQDAAIRWLNLVGKNSAEADKRTSFPLRVVSTDKKPPCMAESDASTFGKTTRKCLSQNLAPPDHAPWQLETQGDASLRKRLASPSGSTVIELGSMGDGMSTIVVVSVTAEGLVSGLAYDHQFID